MLWVDGSVSQWEMYVFHSNQIGSTINSQSNFSLKMLMVCGEIWFRYSSERLFFSFYERGWSIHILGLHRHLLLVRLRVLVMDEVSLEVWNGAWASCMQMKRDTFTFSYKGNLILLFFTRIKFNLRSRIVASSSEEIFYGKWDYFDFERGRTFTIVSAGNDCFLHANIARYYFIVTKG